MELVPGYSPRALSNVGLCHDRQAHFRYSPPSTAFRSGKRRALLSLRGGLSVSPAPGAGAVPQILQQPAPGSPQPLNEPVQRAPLPRAAIAANASGDEARALPRPPAGLARMRLRAVAIRCSWPSADDGARSAERPTQTPSTVGPDPTQSPIRTAGRSFGGHRPALECKRGRIPRRPVSPVGPASPCALRRAVPAGVCWLPAPVASAVDWPCRDP